MGWNLPKHPPIYMYMTVCNNSRGASLLIHKHTHTHEHSIIPEEEDSRVGHTEPTSKVSNPPLQRNAMSETYGTTI